MTPPATNTRLGPIGIWSMELRYGDPVEGAEAVAELDELGYAAVWVPDDGGDITGDLDRLLTATKRTTIATGILNIWRHEAPKVASWWTKLPDDQRRRLLLGLGVSHPQAIGEAWSRPLTVMRDYLDQLQQGGVDLGTTCIAALRQKMLELARDRTSGSHPYLVTPQHVAWARQVLGPGKLLLPELHVVLETDPERARGLARQSLSTYAKLTNYVTSWQRLGFSEDDVATLSDRLVDEVVAWGDIDHIVERVRAYQAAGADHVCLQVVTGTATPQVSAARPGWRTLAKALL